MPCAVLDAGILKGAGHVVLATSEPTIQREETEDKFYTQKDNKNEPFREC